MQISVRNVTWDLMLRKAYIDREACTPDSTVVLSNWTSNMQKATFTDGVINDPINGTGRLKISSIHQIEVTLNQLTHRAENRI